ncbi:MAG TPA: hypothetical protein VNZ53_51515 [Steroidobacteraceae bacterium]|jgi:hypothetical protein|nr:hypothetical protein [Steroidobacteraceae bacterium]
MWISTQSGRRRPPFARLLLALITLIFHPLFVQAVHGAELSAAQTEYLKKLDEPVLLRGDYFKAITIAYEDFSKRLARNESKSKIVNGAETTRFQWLSHIQNYDIHIEQTDTMFLVYFSPTVRGDPPIILGGVAKYEIDRKTFQVAAKTTIK